MFFKKYLYVVSFCRTMMVLGAEDYFSENFDTNKNCKQEKLIFKLKKEKKDGDSIRCSTVAGKGSDMDNWKQCKKDLIQKLLNMCTYRTVLEVRMR